MENKADSKFIKKLIQRAEVTRNAHFLLFNKYKKLNNFLNAFLILGASTVAILTFANYDSFKPINPNLNEEIYKLFVAGLAAIVFILTVIDWFFKFESKASTHENVAKQLTILINNIRKIKNEISGSENNNDYKARLTEQYNNISENAPSLSDRVFYKAKQNFFIKKEISTMLDKNPFLPIWLFKISKRIYYLKMQIKKNEVNDVKIDKDQKQGEE